MSEPAMVTAGIDTPHEPTSISRGSPRKNGQTTVTPVRREVEESAHTRTLGVFGLGTQRRRKRCKPFPYSRRGTTFTALAHALGVRAQRMPGYRPYQRLTALQAAKVVAAVEAKRAKAAATRAKRLALLAAIDSDRVTGGSDE